MTDTIDRGQVFWVELDPVRGSGMAKTRPCVILSANEINRRRRTVIVVPLTSTPHAASFPLLIDTPSAGKGSKVRTEHLRSVDKARGRSAASASRTCIPYRRPWPRSWL